MEIKFDSKELSVFTRTEIAKEISSAEALMALAKDDEIIVRRAVAEINGHVPAGVLNLLATDNSVDVRRSVTASKNATKEILITLSTDKEVSVRFGV